MITQKNRLYKLAFSLIVTLSTVYCLLSTGILAMDIDLWYLPNPPESSIVWKDRNLQINGINARGTHLSSQLEVKDVIDFYKDTLLKNGWQIKDYFKEQNIMAFIKDGRFMYVAGKENGKDVPCDVYVISSPSDLAICRILAKYMQTGIIMQQDSDGKDIPDVPRYPISKRMVSIFAPEEGAILLYQAVANPKEIAKFYQTQLKAYGWELASALRPEFLLSRVPELENIKLMLFQKEDETLFINAYLIPKEATNKDTTIITIVKNMLEEFTSSVAQEE